MQTTPERPSTPSATAQEGLLLARYLLKTGDIPGEALDRYEAGCAALLDCPPETEDLNVCRFLLRRPWSLPFLDAAAGLRHPHALLRKKLFLMLAVLEATPAGASIFTPRPAPRAVVFLRLARLGIQGAFKAAVGLILYPIARRQT